MDYTSRIPDAVEEQHSREERLYYRAAEFIRVFRETSADRVVSEVPEVQDAFLALMFAVEDYECIPF